MIKKDIQRLLDFLIPPDHSILNIHYGEGASFIPHASNTLKTIDARKEKIEGHYDYILLIAAIGILPDIQNLLEKIRDASFAHSRVIITSYNPLWHPIIKLNGSLGRAKPSPWQNWVSMADTENFLYLAGFEVIKKGRRVLCPFYIPLISAFLNRYLSTFPLIRHLCLFDYLVARPLVTRAKKDASVSIVIPCRNEAGNIERLVKRLPKIGSRAEIIFIEGNSNDNTLQAIKDVKKQNPTLNITITTHAGKGKGDAVRKGFDLAGGDILMILDADISVAPEDLVKFYDALIEGKGDFINGSRLVYPLEKESMRFLNFLGNKFFSVMFSWLLDQRIKDTLCGTKVLWKKDYEKIKKQREFFGDFDPFGDFDLLFGAAKLNLKIIDLPIRYHERTYGATNISRFAHGWLLLKMCVFAMGKIKFI